MSPDSPAADSGEYHLERCPEGLIDPPLERKLAEKRDEGWVVVETYCYQRASDEEQDDDIHRTVQMVVLQKSNFGKASIHVVVGLLTIWWTLGLGNLLYALFSYVSERKQTHLYHPRSEMGRLEVKNVDTEPARGGWMDVTVTVENYDVTERTSDVSVTSFPDGPRHVVFVVDRSWSMKTEIKEVVDALDALLGRGLAASSIRYSLVTYLEEPTDEVTNVDLRAIRKRLQTIKNRIEDTDTAENHREAIGRVLGRFASHSDQRTIVVHVTDEQWSWDNRAEAETHGLEYVAITYEEPASVAQFDGDWIDIDRLSTKEAEATIYSVLTGVTGSHHDSKSVTLGPGMETSIEFTLPIDDPSRPHSVVASTETNSSTFPATRPTTDSR